MQIGDKIVFKFDGEIMKYHVTGDPSTGIFLSLLGEGYPNDRIFKILGIDDRCGFCEGILGKNIKNRRAMFPEVNSLENLEKIVNAIYQEIINKSVPKYKEGDIVRILPRQGVASDYPLRYTDSMNKYANDLFSIKEVHKFTIESLKDYIDCKTYEEPFYYILDSNLRFSWSSKMFSKVTEIDTMTTADIGKINIGGAPFYIDTHTAAITCDKTIDGPFLYPEKSEEPEYKLNFSVKLLNFLKDV